MKKISAFRVTFAQFLDKKMSKPTEKISHAFVDSVVNEYAALLDFRNKLEADCIKLKEFIDNQIQQIHQLNDDFNKLRQEYGHRKDLVGTPKNYYK